MLSIKNELKIQSGQTEYSHHLRVIGQDLDDVLPEQLEITLQDQAYVVRGRGRSAAPSGKTKGSLKKILTKLGRGNREEQPQETVPFFRTYTLEDIRVLAESARAARKKNPLSPDVYVLGERLRTVGEMVEAKAGELLQLTVDSYRVVIQYRNTQGDVRKEEHSAASLYHVQLKGHSQRGSARETDPWDNVRKK